MGFSNRDRLRRKMKAIPVGVRKAARAQLKANALELAALQKQFAEESRLTGELIDSIKARDVSDSTRMTWRISAGNRQVPYARFVEFGTAGSAARAPRQNLNFKRTVVMTKAYAAHAATPAQPFFWPAYRLRKRAFRSRMTRAAKRAIQEAIQ